MAGGEGGWKLAGSQYLVEEFKVDSRKAELLRVTSNTAV